MCCFWDACFVEWLCDVASACSALFVFDAVLMQGSTVFLTARLRCFSDILKRVQIFEAYDLLFYDLLSEVYVSESVAGSRVLLDDNPDPHHIAMP